MEESWNKLLGQFYDQQAWENPGLVVGSLLRFKAFGNSSLVDYSIVFTFTTFANSRSLMLLNIIYNLKIPKLVYSVQSVYHAPISNCLFHIPNWRCNGCFKLMSSPELLSFHSVLLCMAFTIATDPIYRPAVTTAARLSSVFPITP